MYLESVQNGLDYVLGICKCLRVSKCLSVFVREKFCNITPHLTFNVTDFESREEKRRGG